MKKNNSLKVQILTTLGAFAGAVLCCYYRKRRNVNVLIKAISDTLGDEEVTDFKSFSDHLSEYYGITAKNIYGNVVEYSSDSIKSVTSDDIQSYSKKSCCYDMDNLETAFSVNRELWI